MSNPFYHAFLQGVEDITHPDRSLLFVCNTHDDPQEAGRYFAQLSAKGVDGIILASHETPAQAAGGAGLPFISVDWPPSRGYSVLIDLESAGYQATLHLAQHGHRRIGLITYGGDSANVIPVNAGYRRALHTAGLPSDPALVARVDGFGMVQGAAGARQLLALPHPPSAIFAIADLLALGALRAIRAAGLRIPQDIALASFNDIPQAELADPPLTTVAAPVRQMGVEAMKMLQALIAGDPPTQRRVMLPTTLVVRESCGFH
jgi:DNA-binding LacI/PurR family transcriptional regulator